MVWLCCAYYWEILTLITGLIPHSPVIFLLVEAAKELRAERKEKGILFNSIFIQPIYNYSIERNFFPSHEKTVYSVEWCKEVRGKVSFWHQEAYLFKYARVVLLIKGLFYFCICLFYIILSRGLPLRR